jgi:hypothetical protein
MLHRMHHKYSDSHQGFTATKDWATASLNTNKLRASQQMTISFAHHSMDILFLANVLFVFLFVFVCLLFLFVCSSSFFCVFYSNFLCFIFVLFFGTRGTFYQVGKDVTRLITSLLTFTRCHARTHTYELAHIYVNSRVHIAAMYT